MDGYPLFMVQLYTPAEPEDVQPPEPIDMEADTEPDHDDGEDECYEAMDSDEGMDRQMDMVFGEGVVTMYQYYDIGGWLDLGPMDYLDLETYFFEGNKHEPKDIEVMTLGGRWVLKIKHAKERQVRIRLHDKEYRLIKVYHYPKPLQPELSISFPIRRH